jgi:hypothetical protein
MKPPGVAAAQPGGVSVARSGAGIRTPGVRGQRPKSSAIQELWGYVRSRSSRARSGLVVTVEPGGESEVRGPVGPGTREGQQHDAIALGQSLVGNRRAE